MCGIPLDACPGISWTANLGKRDVDACLLVALLRAAPFIMNKEVLRIRMLVVALAFGAVGITANAQCVQNFQGQTLCPPAETRCAADRYGEWYCSGPGGDALQNRDGVPVCGKGRCISDVEGRIWCSKSPNGSAALNWDSKPVCTDGCAPAVYGA